MDAGFYADEILLCREPPAGLSARDALACEVSSLVAMGHEVLATLRVGKRTLRARLTPAAVRQLGPGTRAVAVVKTAAIHRLGGPEDSAPLATGRSGRRRNLENGTGT